MAKHRPQRNKATQRQRRTPAIERLERVREGLAAGKSQRGIARELGCDDGTVGRDIEKLRLPVSLLAKIEAGAPAEPILREARRRAALVELRQRVDEEVGTECHSDALAAAGLRFLIEKPLIRADEMMIMDQVGRVLWPVGDIVAAPRRDPQKTFTSLDREPLPASMPERIDYYISILVLALQQNAPEKLIREHAIAKMAKAVNDPQRRPQALRPWHREYNFERYAWERKSPRPRLPRQGRP